MFVWAVGFVCLFRLWACVFVFGLCVCLGFVLCVWALGLCLGFEFVLVFGPWVRVKRLGVGVWGKGSEPLKGSEGFGVRVRVKGSEVWGKGSGKGSEGFGVRVRVWGLGLGV